MAVEVPEPDGGVIAAADQEARVVPGEQAVDPLEVVGSQRVEALERPALLLDRSEPEAGALAGRRQVPPPASERERLDRAAKDVLDQGCDHRMGLPRLPGPQVDLAVAVPGDNLFGAGSDRHAGDVPGDPGVLERDLGSLELARRGGKVPELGLGGIAGRHQAPSVGGET